MESQKANKVRHSYEPDFKTEILRMLISGKSVKEVSENFGIAKNVGRQPGSVSLENGIKNKNKS
jgi:transposase-like protein